MEKRIGVCGGNLFDGNGKPTYSFSIGTLKNTESAIINIFKSAKNKIIGKSSSYFNYSNKVKEVDGVIGADMMICREALEKSGLFDEDFFLYLEESELTHRIKKAGFLSYSVPQAKIMHLEGQSFKGSKNRDRFYIFGSYLYYGKVFGKEAVEKHYKERLRFWLIIQFFSLGLLSKKCSFKRRLLREEYERWENKNKI